VGDTGSVSQCEDTKHHVGGQTGQCQRNNCESLFIAKPKLVEVDLLRVHERRIGVADQHLAHVLDAAREAGLADLDHAGAQGLDVW